MRRALERPRKRGVVETGMVNVANPAEAADRSSHGRDPVRDRVVGVDQIDSPRVCTERPVVPRGQALRPCHAGMT